MSWCVRECIADLRMVTSCRSRSLRRKFDLVFDIFTNIFFITEKEEEVEKLSSSVKNLKQERKKLEGNLTSIEETVSDLKQEKESLEKASCCIC